MLLLAIEIKIWINFQADVERKRVAPVDHLAYHAETEKAERLYRRSTYITSTHSSQNSRANGVKILESDGGRWKSPTIPTPNTHNKQCTDRYNRRQNTNRTAK